ncbi:MULTISPECIES: hypothetical protein [Paracoccus]|uniref:hypothetical protein n=1 Tax=Paracoccus TaxID=265 RepID=UPI00258DC4A0|nr:hypothetical protein [Paracoccus sp. (in: a-proteobacteria)]
MEISDVNYDALEKAYAESAKAVAWTYSHWALEGGIENALNEAMGDDASKAVVDLLDAVETLLRDGRGLPKPKLALRDQDYDPDDFDPDQVPR